MDSHGASMTLAAPSATATHRDHLFISYAGEDHVFSDWLALRLAAAGYQVWYDRIKLLGGESYPKDIDDAIKNRTFRLLSVITRKSLSKPNPLKERTLALAISRERNIDFLIPLNLEGIPPTELNWMISDLTYVPFYKGWGLGLAQLLKKLAALNAPRNPATGLERVSVWSSGEERATKTPERIWSNQIPFNEVPSRIIQFRLPPKTDLQTLAQEWVFSKQNATTVWSFGPPENPAKGMKQKASIEWRKPAEDLVIRPRSVVSYLIREHVIRDCVSRGMRIEPQGRDLFFPSGLFEGDKLHFVGYDGETTYVKVVGDRSFRVTGDAREVSRYHLAFSPRPAYRGDDTYLRMRIGVFWTDTAGTPLPLSKAARRRKALGKRWWNHEWLCRMLACTSWLCDGRDEHVLTTSESGNLTLAGEPLSLEASAGIDESVLESRLTLTDEEELEEEPDEDSEVPRDE